MKTHFLLTTLFFGLFLMTLGAQAPNKFNYQAVAKKADGSAVSGPIEVKFTILDGATAVYEETHSTNADNFGLFNLQIGAGTPQSGSWAAINWGAGAGKSLKVTITPAGQGPIDMGTQELVSVPYAQHATGLKLPFAADLDAGGSTAFSVVNHNGSSIAGVSYGNGDGIMGQYQGTGNNAGVSAVNFSTNPNSQAVWAGNIPSQTGATLCRGPFSGTFWGGPVLIDVNGGENLRIGDDASLWDVNQANVVGIKGQQNSSAGGIQLGVQAGLYADENGQLNIGSTSTTVWGPFKKSWDGLAAVINLGTNDNAIIAAQNNGMSFHTLNHPNALTLREDGENTYNATTHRFSGGNVGIHGYPGLYPLYVYQPGSYGMGQQRSDNGMKWEFYIDTPGDLNFYGNSSLKSYISIVNGSYNQVSDRRLKNSIAPLAVILPKLMALKPVTYFMNQDTGQTHPEIGLIAQEVKEVFPEFAGQITDKEGNEFNTVNYAGFSVIAIKAIQEQQKLIEALTERVKALEQKVQELENK